LKVFNNNNTKGNEIYFYSPSFKETDALNTWFCFPAQYNIGMSSLGFLHLYRLLDETSFVNVERVFTDTQKTLISIKNLDLISFSFSFEFDFLNVFNILKKNNIPLFASERTSEYPLVMGGGAVLTANPEPFYDIFDFIIIGDGEEVIIDVAKVLYGNKDCSKEQRLELLAEIEGVYVPKIQKFSEIKRRIFNSKDAIYSPIVTDNTAFADTFLVEVSRGCPYKCNFCLTSHINQPIKHSSFESIKNAINIGLSKSNNLGLLGALVPANPCFENLCEYLLELRQKQEFKVSIGSLRADFISPLNIQMLTACGQKNTTIAIEAGSQRMRDFINKKLTEEQILNAAKTCFDNGLDGLKLYAMIGFPNETQEDIDELLSLVKKIKMGKKVTLSVNSFVPKKFTPFEIYSMESSKSLEKKMNYLKKECHKIGVAFRPCSVAWNEIQGVISTGTRELMPALYSAYLDNATIGAFKKHFRNKN